MKNVLKPLAKSVLIPLGLTAAAFRNRCSYSSENVWIRYPSFELSKAKRTTLIISNEEMNIIKIIKLLEESGLLIKTVSETIQNEVKEQKDGFPSMLLGTLGASLLGNLLTGKGTIRAGEGKVRVGQDF